MVQRLSDRLLSPNRVLVLGTVQTVDVGRTKMTAPRVAGDELAFLHQVRRCLASQRLECHAGRPACTRFGVALAISEVASKPAKCGRVAALLSRVADAGKHGIRATIVQTTRDERLDPAGTWRLPQTAISQSGRAAEAESRGMGRDECSHCQRSCVNEHAEVTCSVNAAER